MTFNAELCAAGAIQVLALRGRLDSATSGELDKTLLPLQQPAAQPLLLDCAALDYISSAGLRVVLMAAKRAKQARSPLALCALQPHVKEVFEISGFLKILEVAPDRAAGLARLEALGQG